MGLEALLEEGAVSDFRGPRAGQSLWITLERAENASIQEHSKYDLINIQQTLKIQQNA